MREHKYRAKTLGGIWFYWKITDGIDYKNLPIDWETLQQYTGLQDENNKDIYDGDIVNVITLNEEEEIKGAVIEYFEYEAKYIYKKGDRIYTIEDGDEIEVVGNIYENPKLIK